jgi:ATP-dependent 26S proteasome regulatory subunit
MTGCFCSVRDLSLDKQIKNVINLPIKHSEVFENVGIAQPKGARLSAPPGTLLARAVAGHTDTKFIRVSGSEFVQKYISEGVLLVREIFVMARSASSSGTRSTPSAGLFGLRERTIHVSQELFEMAVFKVVKKDDKRSMEHQADAGGGSLYHCHQCIKKLSMSETVRSVN